MESATSADLVNIPTVLPLNGSRAISRCGNRQYLAVAGFARIRLVGLLPDSCESGYSRIPHGDLDFGWNGVSLRARVMLRVLRQLVCYTVALAVIYFGATFALLCMWCPDFLPNSPGHQKVFTDEVIKELGLPPDDGPGGVPVTAMDAAKAPPGRPTRRTGP
jgi:hypothetical protein